MKRFGLTNIILVLSVSWLVTAVILGWFAHSPHDCDGTFSCLTANEWGDFLAGVFAPVAFLWLVAAVFVQSKELSEQREELILTRREFEYNRTVMEAQAIDAKKQAEFIGEQTHVLTTDQVLTLHREFIDLMSQRISVWAEFQDPSSKVSSSSGSYAEFWTIVGFYQRLALLLQLKNVKPAVAAQLFGFNALWWYRHFFIHERTEACSGDDLEAAKAAWLLIKAGAEPCQVLHWETQTDRYEDIA